VLLGCSADATEGSLISRSPSTTAGKGRDAEAGASGISGSVAVARWTARSGTRLMGAPSPRRRAWPSVSRGGATGPSGAAARTAAGTSRLGSILGRRGAVSTGIGSTSGDRAVSRCATGAGATAGSSLTTLGGVPAGRGEGRVAGGAASTPSHSPDSSIALCTRRCTRGREIIAGPSLRVVGLASASTMPAGASALTWWPIGSVLTDGS
jgi:hypothetical protein